MKFTIALTAILSVCLLVELQVIPSPPLWPLLLAIACAGFLMVGKDRSSDALHPVRVFGSLWCLLLALASLRLLPTVSAWDSWTWTLLLTGMLAFVGGFWLAGLKQRRRWKLPAAVREIPLRRTLLPARKTLRLAFMCILVGTCILAYEDTLIGTIPMFAANPDIARMKLFPVVGQSSLNTFSIKLIHPFVEFVKYGVFLAAIVLLQRTHRNRKINILCLCLILTGTLVYASQGGRGPAVQVLVVLLVLYHYLSRRVHIRQLAVAGLVLFVFLGTYGAYRIQKSHSAPMVERAMSESAFPPGTFWAGPAFAYFTTTSSFQVFDNLTHDLHFYTKPPHGFLFYAFHSLIPRASIANFDADLYTSQTITPTFLGEFYADFGYLGVLLGPLLLGLGYGWAYSQMKRGRGVYPIYVQALLLQMLIYFPYTNLFSDYLTWIFDLFFMYFLIRTLERRAKPLPIPSPEAHRAMRPQGSRGGRLRDRPAEG